MRQYEQAIFYTVWDKENNGVFLTSDSKNALKINPRPVFYEELNLFGFNKFWSYPQTEEPLLWRAGRRYYYKGEFVAEAKGGNIYEKPQIKITDAGKNLNLEPIDTIKLLDNCF